MVSVAFSTPLSSYRENAPDNPQVKMSQMISPSSALSAPPLENSFISFPLDKLISPNVYVCLWTPFTDFFSAHPLRLTVATS